MIPVILAVDELTWLATQMKSPDVIVIVTVTAVAVLTAFRALRTKLMQVGVGVLVRVAVLVAVSVAVAVVVAVAVQVVNGSDRKHASAPKARPAHASTSAASAARIIRPA